MKLKGKKNTKRLSVSALTCKALEKSSLPSLYQEVSTDFLGPTEELRFKANCHPKSGKAEKSSES